MFIGLGRGAFGTVAFHVRPKIPEIFAIATYGTIRDCGLRLIVRTRHGKREISDEIL